VKSDEREIGRKEWLDEQASWLFRKGGELFFRSMVVSVTAAGRQVPLATPERHGIRLIRDIAYCEGNDPAHVMDIYLPTHAQGKLPVVLYIHGGAFRYCSKDTHWMMALSYARQGFCVFNINYRLAPKYRFPAALEDASAALIWVHENAGDYGCDPSKLVLAGESAGANLCTGLTIATSYHRKEAWAKELWSRAIRPSAVAALCGILQVSDPERITTKKKMNRWIRDRVKEPAMGYLPLDPNVDASMANPLVILESAGKPRRKLPPFLISVGTKDPILDDSRRLAAALERLGVPHEAHYYPGALHAFQTMVWDSQAKDYWKTQEKFLNPYVGPLQSQEGDLVSMKSIARVLGLPGSTDS